MKAKEINTGENVAVTTSNFTGNRKPTWSFDAEVIEVDPSEATLAKLVPEGTTRRHYRYRSTEITNLEAVMLHIRSQIEGASLGKAVLVKPVDAAKNRNIEAARDGRLSQGTYVAYFGEYALVPSKFVLGEVEEMRARREAAAERKAQMAEAKRARREAAEAQYDAAKVAAERLVELGGPDVYVASPNMHDVVGVSLTADKLIEIVALLDKEA